MLAAHRAGIKRVIVPERNKADLDEVPKEVKNELEFVFVSKMDQVLEAALEEMPKPKPEISGHGDAAEQLTARTARIREHPSRKDAKVSWCGAAPDAARACRRTSDRRAQPKILGAFAAWMLSVRPY